jgi:hypothetical protein
MSSYEHYCENCRQEVVLHMDGVKLLDSKCPECDAPLDYEDVSADIMGDWIDQLIDHSC